MYSIGSLLACVGIATLGPTSLPQIWRPTALIALVILSVALTVPRLSQVAYGQQQPSVLQFFHANKLRTDLSLFGVPASERVYDRADNTLPSGPVKVETLSAQILGTSVPQVVPKLNLPTKDVLGRDVYLAFVAWLSPLFAVKTMADGNVTIFVWMSSTDDPGLLGTTGYFFAIADVNPQNLRDNFQLLSSDFTSGGALQGNIIGSAPRFLGRLFKISNHLFAPGRSLAFFAGAFSSKQSWQFSAYFDSLQFFSQASVPAILSTTYSVPYHGGPVLSNSFLYVVFWGSDWNTCGPVICNSNMIQQINSGLQTLIANGYFDSLDQYGYGSIRFVGSTVNALTLTSSQTITLQQFQNFALGLSNAGTIPKYHSQVLFILPPTTDASTGCGAPAGCHSYTLTNQIDPRSILGLPIVNRFTFNDIMTTATHELVEAITDPAGGSGWYNLDVLGPPVNYPAGEIADLCEIQTALTPSINGVPVAYYESNSASTRCVAGGGNGLIPVTLSISDLPQNVCTMVKWSTNLVTLQQPACGSQPQWVVRAASGSTISINSTVNVDAGTRYRLSTGNTWTVSSPFGIQLNYVKETITSTTSSTTSTSSRVSIPGFSETAILVGIGLGLVHLVVTRKRRYQTHTIVSSTASSSAVSYSP